MNITIASINLQSGVATTRGYWHYGFTAWRYALPHSAKAISACGEILKRERVDIACVQEISEESFRTGWKSQTKELAESAGMAGQKFFLTARFGSLMREGNAIVSRQKLEMTEQHPLTGGIMRSAIGEAIVRVGEKNINVFVAHTSLGSNLREKQIREMVDLLKGKTGPLILCGDFNEPDAKAFDELRAKTRLKQMRTLKTYPSWKPTRSLDYIFLSGEFRLLDCHIPKDEPCSDHSILVVKAELD